MVPAPLYAGVWILVTGSLEALADGPLTAGRRALVEGEETGWAGLGLPSEGGGPDGGTVPMLPYYTRWARQRHPTIRGRVLSGR